MVMDCLAMNVLPICLVLSFLNCQLIFGVRSGKFSHVLEGMGRAFAIKFRPRAFYPFVNLPVARFTNNTVNIGDVFSVAGALNGTRWSN